MNEFFLIFFLPLIIVGICVSAALLVILIKVSKKKTLTLRNYAAGYGICVGANLALIVISLGFLGAQSFIILCGPTAIFGFMLTKRLIQNKAVHNKIIRFAYKSIAIVLIWFMAFFPFSLFAIEKIVNLPEERAAKQELLRVQDEILHYETFADLTPFGLGLYKLGHAGDEYLWDVTQPKDRLYSFDGVVMAYEYYINRKDAETWDAKFEHSNKGKDVMYDVLFYEGTYIIVAPLWDNPGKWGVVYLCKDLAEDVDLFNIEIHDTQTIETLQAMAGERISRKELAEKLGKVF